MILAGLAKHCSGRVHYAWIVLGVTFLAALAAVGVRSAPGVMIVPLQRSFGWDVGTISGAVSVNILLLGILGPFIMALMDRFGLKNIMVGCLLILMAATGFSVFMTEPWQLFLTWGVLVGIGSAAGSGHGCRRRAAPRASAASKRRTRSWTRASVNHCAASSSSRRARA